MQTDNYKLYTAIDFLKDEDFLRWQIYHAKEDTLYWHNIIEKEPDVALVIREAEVLYNEYVRFNDFRLSSSEKAASLEAFQDAINQNKNKKARYKILSLSVAAACVVAFAIVSLLFWKKEVSVQDIETFAQTLSETDLNSTDTKLILSENNTITLSNKESSIQYDVNAIKADGNLVLKENTSSYNQIITPFGKRSTIVFSDGTKVWLNAGSKLIYPSEFRNDKREIYVDGEIYIEVSEDKKRPFIVKTKETNVSVLGTKFNVSAYENDETKSVVLVSGAVSISSNTQGETFLLKPNQMYSNIDGAYSVKNIDADKYVSWTKGLYQFESEKLKSIASRLGRYYGVKISCDTFTAELKCSGKLDLKDDLDKLLDELTKVLPIKHNRDVNGNYTLNNKKLMEKS
ncbi:MAG TPA: FecR family protein [Sphingobacterium sp.]|nr:FecR family protein [Sphingobacterium sp.]